MSRQQCPDKPLVSGFLVSSNSDFDFPSAFRPRLQPPSEAEPLRHHHRHPRHRQVAGQPDRPGPAHVAHREEAQLGEATQPDQGYQEEAQEAEQEEEGEEADEGGREPVSGQQDHSGVEDAAGSEQAVQPHGPVVQSGRLQGRHRGRGEKRVQV